MSERAPYHDADATRVRRYLDWRGRRLVDPLGADASPNDPYFAPSLACARRQMRAAFAARRPDGTPFRAYPAFVESHRPNAFAVDLGGGLHLCGINTGMVTSLFELAAFSFSQADLFPEVGNPAAEASPGLPDDFLLGYWIADRVVAAMPVQATAIGEDMIPIDPERRLMAHFLTQIMLRFVWFHELFHGLNGHSGYVAAARASFELHEIPTGDEATMMEVERVPAVGVPWHRLQPSLELDADRAAFRTMVELQRAGDEPFVVLAEKPLALRLKLTHYAAVLMTVLFDQAAKRRMGTGATHPVGRQRLLSLLRTIAGEASDPANGEAGGFMAALGELDRLRVRMPALPETVTLMADLSSTAVLTEIDRANAVLEAARGEIDPHGFSPREIAGDAMRARP